MADSCRFSDNVYGGTGVSCHAVSGSDRRKGMLAAGWTRMVNALLAPKSVPLLFTLRLGKLIDSKRFAKQIIWTQWREHCIHASQELQFSGLELLKQFPLSWGGWWCNYQAVLLYVVRPRPSRDMQDSYLICGVDGDPFACLTDDFVSPTNSLRQRMPNARTLERRWLRCFRTGALNEAAELGDVQRAEELFKVPGLLHRVKFQTYCSQAIRCWLCSSWIFDIRSQSLDLNVCCSCCGSTEELFPQTPPQNQTMVCNTLLKVWAKHFQHWAWGTSLESRVNPTTPVKHPRPQNSICQSKNQQKDLWIS